MPVIRTCHLRSSSTCSRRERFTEFPLPSSSAENLRRNRQESMFVPHTLALYGGECLNGTANLGYPIQQEQGSLPAQSS